jgi:hypothetical protein
MNSSRARTTTAGGGGEAVRDACIRDARALAEVALAREMRGPDGGRVGARAAVGAGERRSGVLYGEGMSGGRGSTRRTAAQTAARGR